MKICERGLGTGALVGIIVGVVIAIVVPVTIVAVLLVGGGGGGGAILTSVPVYPGAQAAEENVAQLVVTNMLVGMGSPAGWSGEGYLTQASPETVVDWYKTQMEGWMNLGDNTVESYGVTYYVLTYQKGNDAATIATFVYPGVGNFLLLAAGPMPTQTPAGGSGTGGSIAGTWQGTHLGATETFTFKSDGTYDWFSDGNSQSGTWSMNGDILRLDGSPPDFKVVFSTNSMKWYEQDPSTGNWDVLSRSFTKVA